MEEIVSEAFMPQEQPASPGVESPGEETLTGAPGEAPPGGADLEGLNSAGLMRGVAAGQAGMAPGGRPELQMLMANLGADGNPNLTAGVSRRLPV